MVIALVSENWVIGAGSLVRRSVPQNAVALGNL